jgi:hypothetical protein
VVPAFEVLKEILASGTLRGSGNEGFVKGNRPAVCFSEIPLSAMHEFAQPPEVVDTARYRNYGTVIHKSALFKAGGRPVIYLPDGEGQWIPAEEKWRHVRYEPPNVDFTHEREWRVPGHLDLKQFSIYLIVWSASEARAIMRLALPLQILGVVPMQHIRGML